VTGRYTLTPRAQADVAEIWDYTAKRWGEDQAAFYLRRMFDTIERLAGKPDLGASCEHVRAGYRKHPCGSHVLFYRLVEGDVDAVRVLHERMDVTRHL